MDYAAERRRMVEEQLRRRGVSDQAVLSAMEQVPREEFVNPRERRRAYQDSPLSLVEGQTISQPYIVALMSELLEPLPGKRVLEIGTGSGYQAAVLAACGCVVYSVEIRPALHDLARENLQRTGYTVGIHLRLGSGFEGWPDEAPFDAALLTCAPRRIPETILEQVSPGGLVVGPRGGGYHQELVRLRLTGEKIDEETVTDVLFVPMIDGR